LGVRYILRILLIPKGDTPPDTHFKYGQRGSWEGRLSQGTETTTMKFMNLGAPLLQSYLRRGALDNIFPVRFQSCNLKLQLDLVIMICFQFAHFSNKRLDEIVTGLWIIRICIWT
jgi:hypothetical protein